MFALFWITVLFSLSGSNTSTVASALGRPFCSNGFCITLNEGQITAEAGLCVVLPCSFTTADEFTPKNIVWFKCESWKRKCGDSDIIFHTNPNKIQPEFLGRVLLLDPDVSQRNCSIMINDLTTSDSGSYQLRVNGLQNGRTDGFMFTSKTIVSVKDSLKKPTVTIPSLIEGQQAILTCTAPGLCSGTPPKITWRQGGEVDLKSIIPGNITVSLETENRTAVTHRDSSNLTFIPSAEHHNTNITCKVSFNNHKTTEETITLKVNYKRQPQITGNTTVKEGDALNLTCSVESFPQSLVVWTKHSPNGIYLQNNTGLATFVILNVTSEDSGQYVCTATHLGDTVSVYADVKVTWFSKILKGSGCALQSELLTCVCITKGFPLPTITWPLLKDHTVYTVINTVSNHTLNTTVTLSLNKHHNFSVECDSSHENGEAKENLTVQQHFLDKEAIQSKTILETVSRVDIIIAFLIGFLLSATICCLAIKCNRKTLKNSGNLDETLKMVSQVDPLIDRAQAVQNDKTHVQEEAGNGAMDADKSSSELMSELSSSLKDVQYASIDFSIMMRRSSREVAKEQESTLTEYAEIKTGAKDQKKDESKGASKTVEGKEEDLMTKHDDEIKQVVSEEQEGDVEAIYSTVRDVSDKI
ncbi:sialic acid-binding Ig-like lectin 5 [Girardinichthys multiradiatus]|uniref:sialic acid-binding Ig-like lectin 5 n=1 Tax=Girardinichthys multiradiatus TaxID=208333 RepID=UPI001FAD7749|nr:sialic acid-binding Ig-like lectin 5 [Girardinichthys multiradiatus]